MTPISSERCTTMETSLYNSAVSVFGSYRWYFFNEPQHFNFYRPVSLELVVIPCAILSLISSFDDNNKINNNQLLPLTFFPNGEIPSSHAEDDVFIKRIPLQRHDGAILDGAPEGGALSHDFAGIVVFGRLPIHVH